MDSLYQRLKEMDGGTFQRLCFSTPQPAARNLGRGSLMARPAHVAAGLKTGGEYVGAMLGLRRCSAT